MQEIPKKLPENTVVTRGYGGDRPYLIVLGNEKGGSGKSTTAMHITVSLLYAGLKVGVFDLDGRQQTLARYVENRLNYQNHVLKGQQAPDLPMPVFKVLGRSNAENRIDAERDEKNRFEQAYAELAPKVDVLVLDCPGSDTFLSRLAHTAADTLVTPVNDSFVDLDLLARIDAKSHRVMGPSLYSEMVWKARQRRMMADGSSIDWIVIRNRVASIHAKNKERVEKALTELEKRIGMRFVSGLSERVIYRELFLAGLTLIDLKKYGGIDGRGLTLSHVAARNELRQLVAGLSLPTILMQKATFNAENS